MKFYVYFKHLVLDIDSNRLRGIPSDREVGQVFELGWADRFHYIGQKTSQLERYIKENAK